MQFLFIMSIIISAFEEASKDFMFGPWLFMGLINIIIFIGILKVKKNG